jgi:hypothetical protein
VLADDPTDLTAPAVAFDAGSALRVAAPPVSGIAAAVEGEGCRVLSPPGLAGSATGLAALFAVFASTVSSRGGRADRGSGASAS